MIGRGTLVSVLNNAVGALLGLVSLNFITAYGGKSAWGMWLYAYALMGLAAVVTGLGYPQAHVQRLSGGHQEGRANATFLSIKLALTAAFAVLSLAGFWIVTRGLGRELEDTTLSVLIVALAFYVVLSLRQVFDITFQGQRMFALLESVQFVDTLLTVPSTMTAALAVGRLNGAPVPFPGWADATIALFGLEGRVPADQAALWIGLGFLVGKTGSLAYSGLQFARLRFAMGRPAWATFRTYSRFAAPLTLVAALAVASTQLDRVLLGFFWTESVVAEYGLALRLVAPLLVVSLALGNALFPTASRQHASHDLPATRRTLADAERFLSMAILPLLMLAAVFAPEAVRIVTSGTSFDRAIPLLWLLIPHVLLMSLLMPSRSFLLGYDRPGSVARLTVMMFLVVAVLGVALVAPGLLGVPLAGLGGVGAALAMSLAAAAGFVYLRVLTHRDLALPWVPPGFFRQVAAAAGAGLALWVIRDALGPGAITRAWQLVPFAPLGLALYAVLLFLLGGFSPRDRRLLRDLAHPARFARYVGTEIGGRPRRGRVK